MSGCNLTGAAMADCNLPADIMIEILSRLPVKSLLRFRCVCKPCCSLITNPSFITKHITPTSHNPNENLLFLSNGPQNSKYLVCMLIHGNKTLDRSINLKIPFEVSSSYANIQGSCNGLLFYLSGPDMFLWNPATREGRKLPEPRIWVSEIPEIDFICFGFGFDANASDYKLVCLACVTESYQNPPVYKAEVYSKKMDSWTEINTDLQCRVNECSSRADFGGGVHWIASGSNNSQLIACFDLGREVFGEIQLPVSIGSGIEIEKELSVVKDLLAVIVYPMQRGLYDGLYHPAQKLDVWVMREYGVKESWTKLLSIESFSGVGRPMAKLSYDKSRFALQIACSRNGRFVWKNHKNKLYLYDSNTREFDNLPKYKAQYIYCTYTETLVSVKGGE